MDIELLKKLLIIAMGSSVVNCAFIQKTKTKIPKKMLMLYTLIVNMVFGILFALTFTDTNIFEAAWVGLFSFIGADTIYKSLEGKLQSYTDLVTPKIEEIKRSE